MSCGIAGVVALIILYVICRRRKIPLTPKMATAAVSVAVGMVAVEMAKKQAGVLEFTVPVAVSTAVKVTRNPVGSNKTQFHPTRSRRRGRGGGTSKKLLRKLKGKTRRQFGGTFQEEALAVFNFLFQVTLKEFLLTGSLDCLQIEQRANELFDNLDKNA
uniref:Uncharacterized protein n=1 Tax=viral metagenome TaxID=1070528 RepID=A0A6C0K339_9ZZZZ